MRKRILDLHLYLGLLCAPYLFLYGVSGLAFNHGWSSEPIPAGQWQAELQEGTLGAATSLSPLESARDTAASILLARAQAIQADQALVGWVEERSVIVTENGGIDFTIHRPGADYDIVSEPDGTLQVTRTRTGMWAVLKGLHGLRRLDGSPLAPVWWVYTEVSVWTLIFAILSGIYLWARTSHMMLGLGTLTLGAIGFGTLAVGVW